jgi:hypothetical protein
MNIDKVITESINKVIAEVCEVDNAPDGWTDWATTDAANGLTPEEGKAMRMQPGNAAKSKGTIKTKDFGGIPSPKEWKEKYPHIPSYKQYCHDVYGIELR